MPRLPEYLHRRGRTRPPREDVQREAPRERRRGDDEYEERRPRRRSEDEDYDDRPRRRRYEDEYEGERAYERRKPHRAGTVLTLGILGLVFSYIPLAGWILGGIAISMANNDLREMARGRMDRSGEGSTQAGKVCGIIGVVLATVFFVLGCVIRLSHIR